jgi:large subunit ribosomal protein L9
MKVYLLKDIEKVGLAGEIIKISEGYARNFLIPKKLAIEITKDNEQYYLSKLKTVEKRKEVIATKTSMLAERVKDVELVIKRKMHDDGKLYGSISSGDIVDLLAAKGVNVSKNQIEFDKAVKSKGVYEVEVKLSSKLRPKFRLKVVSE